MTAKHHNHASTTVRLSVGDTHYTICEFLIERASRESHTCVEAGSAVSPTEHKREQHRDDRHIRYCRNALSDFRGAKKRTFKKFEGVLDATFNSATRSASVIRRQELSQSAYT